MIKKTLCSILAGLSLISCGDNSTRAIESPDAGIQFVCKDNDTKTEKCGLNNRGTLEYVCQNNQWLKGQCNDLDKCVDNSVQTVECGDVCVGTRQDKCVNGQWQEGTCEELINISNTPDFYYRGIDFDNDLITFERDRLHHDTNGCLYGLGEIGVIDISKNNKITVFDSADFPSSACTFSVPQVKNNRMLYLYLQQAQSSNRCIKDGTPVIACQGITSNYDICDNPYRIAEFNQDHSMLVRYNMNPIPNLCFPKNAFLFESGIIFTGYDSMEPPNNKENIYLYNFDSNINRLIFSDWYNNTQPCHGISETINIGTEGDTLHYGTGLYIDVSNNFIMIGSRRVYIPRYSISLSSLPICVSDLNLINFQPIPVQGFNPHFDSGMIDFETEENNSDQSKIMSYRPRSGYNNLSNGYSLSKIGERVGNYFPRIGMSQNRHFYGNTVITTNSDGSKICKQTLSPLYNFNYQNDLKLKLSNDKIVGVKEDGQIYMCQLRPCTNWEEADIHYFP